MVKKKIEDFNLTEQEFINAYRKHKLITELEELDWDNMDDDTYTKLLVFSILSIDSKLTFVNSENTQYQVENYEIIETQYTPPIKKLNSVIKPEYLFERIEYQKEVIVQGKKGFVTDWENYINGKKYSEYSEDSYERKNWRTLENEWKQYIN